MPLSAPDAAGAPAFPDDPDAYTVVLTRTPADGPLTEIAIHATRGGSALAVYAGDDALDDLIRAARDYERTDPHSDKLPSSRAIILAALDDCGITPAEEGDDTLAAAIEGDPAPALRQALADLVEWQARMGGFEASEWDRARALLDATRS
jgi:hypothetical protein